MSDTVNKEGNAISDLIPQKSFWGVNFQTIQDAPIHSRERRKNNADYSANLMLWVRDRLPESDGLALDSLVSNPPSGKSFFHCQWDLSSVPPPVAKRIYDALDAVIFGQIRTVGARILLCEVVLHRLMQWQSLPNGPELWRRFGKEQALHLLVVRGVKGAKATLDDRMRGFRDDLKKEYALLRRWLQSQNPARRPLPSDKLLQLAKNYADENADSFIRLLGNWNLFESFVQESPEWLTAHNRTSAVFANDFLSRWTHRSVESLRQAISQMHPPEL
jgi:hypothetical protein